MAEGERRRRRRRHSADDRAGRPPAAEPPADGAVAQTGPVHDPEPEPEPEPPEPSRASAPSREHGRARGWRARAPGGGGNGGNGEDRETERGLRGLVGSGSSQVGVGAALRARDAARPTEADLADAEANLQIVRRGWVPREDLPRGGGR